MRSKNVLAESLNHVRVQHVRSHAGDSSASLQWRTDGVGQIVPLTHQAITITLQAIAWKY